MRFEVLREIFLKPLKTVSGVVERRHSHLAPILSNVLMRIKGNRFLLTTTDQEVELVAGGLLEEDTNLEGAITIPARKLMDICRALPDDSMLSFSVEDERIILKANRSRFTLSSLPADEFPVLEDDLKGVEFSVPQNELRALIEKAYFAMAEQDVRYYLNGLLLEIKKGVIYAVASDGHRMAINKITSNMASGEDIRVIIPRKGVLELLRLLHENENDTKVIISHNHIRIITNDVVMTSKLIDGRFPDYERIVPANGNKIILAQRENMKEAFLRVSAVLSDKFRGVRLHFSKNKLKISASNPEQDEVEEDLEIEYAGEEMEISFNVKYLIDLLNVVQTEIIKFIFMDANSSARIEGVGEDNAIYVIMPMRI